jgi:hypothetical protein
MTPSQFTHDISSWLAAISSLFMPLTAFIGGIYGILAYIRSRNNELRINGHSQSIQNLQINSIPPDSSSAVNINASPPSDIVVNMPPHANQAQGAVVESGEPPVTSPVAGPVPGIISPNETIGGTPQ